ncbi:MAG: hypothetical protein CMF62_03425 [Magnetococcales bacterium]|nr:hypothetical protein [Magnetococcales bacterium]
MTNKYNKKEDDKRVTKTIATQSYALNDTDLENLEYKIKRLYGGRYCKLYKLDEVELCAINKYGSKEKYEDEVKKRNIMKNERLICKQTEYNKRKNNLKDAIEESNLNYDINDLLEYKFIDNYLNNREKTKYDIRYIINILKQNKFLLTHTNFEKSLALNLKKHKYYDFEYVYQKTIDEVMNRYISKNKNNKEAIVKIPISL